MCEKKWLEELLRALDGHTLLRLPSRRTPSHEGLSPLMFLSLK